MADGLQTRDIATALAGPWRLSRRIDDALAGAASFVEGTARLSGTGPERVWDEAGQLTLPGGHVLSVERRYLWRIAGAEVEVSFGDGRPFHTFRAEGLAEGTAHLCGEDLYRVSYDFRAWPRWRAVWRVTGPRKDYVSDTGFTPLSGDPV